MSSVIPVLTSIGILFPADRDKMNTPFSIIRYPIIWVTIFFLVIIINKPDNNAETDARKKILRMNTPVITFDKINEPSIIQVIITTERKSGRNGWVSLTI